MMSQGPRLLSLCSAILSSWPILQATAWSGITHAVQTAKRKGTPHRKTSRRSQIILKLTTHWMKLFIWLLRAARVTEECNLLFSPSMYLSKNQGSSNKLEGENGCSVTSTFCHKKNKNNL